MLASASPRRRQILAELGLEPELVSPQVEELTAGDPEAVVLENARRKARAGFGLSQAPAGQPLLVIGCDTEVVIDGEVLGKPAAAAEARARLERLSDREHEVISGLVVLVGHAGAEIEERSGIARSTVRFRRLDAALIDLYLRSGEWRDRAGGYAIQGLGSILVAAVEGDVANVIGLPIGLLVRIAPELFEETEKV